MSFDTEQQEETESQMNLDYKYADWKSTGKLVYGNDEVIIEEHRDAIMRIAKVSRKLRVVVDCGCGAGSVITPYLLREMGCEVITLNSQADGFFPGREPEPREDTLWDLKKAVVGCDADVGIAHDGDADRMMAVDGKGNFVKGDKLLTLLALHEAKSSISIPSDTTRMVRDLLPKRVKIFQTKVGDVYISNSLKDNGGEFGGEQSGAFIFPNMSMCPDGIYAAARLIELIDQSGITFTQMLKNIPDYHIRRNSYAFSGSKEVIMDRVLTEITSMGTVNVLDGVRVDMYEGWLLIRPSGTEPKIRLTIETKKEEDSRKIYERADEIIMKAITS